MQFVAVGLFLIKGGFGFERGETGWFAMRFAACCLCKHPRNQRFWPRISRQIEWAPGDGAKFYSPSGAFASVVAVAEPVGEELCRRYRPQFNYDFEVVVYKKNPHLMNAFQTIKSDGRPLIVFSLRLIEHARNEDELAFVLGHEKAYHLEGHLNQQYQTARSGAERFGGLISLIGAWDRLVRNAELFGARLGGRKFSKTYELEAERLGTWLATIAEYDALRGAAFFMRM